MDEVPHQRPLVVDLVIETDDVLPHHDGLYPGYRYLIGTGIGLGKGPCAEDPDCVLVDQSCWNAVIGKGRARREPVGGIQCEARWIGCLWHADDVVPNGTIRAGHVIGCAGEALWGDVSECGAGSWEVGRGNRLLQGRSAGLDNFAPFLIDEEECPIPAGVIKVRNCERAADVASEDVLAQLGLLVDRAVGVAIEVVMCVEEIVSVVLPKLAVEARAALFGDHCDGATRRDAIVRRIIG